MTLKRTLFLIFILIAGKMVHAQTADEVYDQYVDFNEAFLNANMEKAMTLGEKILPDSAKLKPGIRISFYNFMAQVYEGDHQSANAITYYNRVIAAQPNYYVAHRALGYLYLKDISGKPAAQVVVDAAYVSRIKKALPHLEKAQACDPDDQTLNLIKLLYRNIKDQHGIDTLPARLTELKKNCEDILSSQ
jgi:tetratricopeptide (TPR) repeat protein